MNRKQSLTLFFAYKALLFALAWAALALFTRIWPLSWEHFGALLYQWDAKHIIRVASLGYLAQEPSIQIFPVFPAVIRFFHLFMPSWDWAGILATQVASFFAFFYLYRLARLEMDEKTSLVSVALFAFFPTAYFLTVPYSEAIFCAFTFGGVYYLKTRRFAPAALAWGLAAATRYTGVLIIPVLVLHVLLSVRPNTRTQAGRREFASHAAVAFCAGLGFLSYLVLNKYLYGDWFYYMDAQAKHWSLHLSWPFKGAWVALQGWSSRSPDQRFSIIVMELLFTAVALASLIPLWFRARRTRDVLDIAYVAANLVLFVSLDFWLSRPRYVLTLYPMFLVAAPWFARSPARLMLYTAGSGGLMALYFAVYLKAQWAH